MFMFIFASRGLLIRRRSLRLAGGGARRLLRGVRHAESGPGPTVPTLAPQLEVIGQGAVVRGCLTERSPRREGEALADMEALAEHVCGFSDDGRGVQSDEMMRAAMKKAKIAGEAHRRPLRGQFPAARRLHPRRRVRPAARPPGHLLRERVAADRAGPGAGKGDGLRLSRVPHFHEGERRADPAGQGRGRGRHLRDGAALSDADRHGSSGGRALQDEPAAAAPADREALMEGLLDGTVDMIATDHAPHSAEEKGRGLEKSLMGVVGLETAFSELYTRLVRPGVLTLEKLVELMSVNPAEALRNLPESRRKLHRVRSGRARAGQPRGIPVHGTKHPLRRRRRLRNLPAHRLRRKDRLPLRE